MMALILVVDDEFALAELLRAMIEDEGHAVLTAHDGQAGLARMLADRPDLIFTDTTMPVMSGPDMVRAMAKDPALSGIRVVAMSAMPEETVGLEYPRYAAFLHKPFRLTEVTRLLSRLLPRR
jgi:CheY-like chemotaxis protein